MVLGVAARTGAPVAPTLRALAAALRRTAAADRAVHVALAGPRTSANVVLALPVLGVVLASLWGVDTLGVLLGSPFGWLSLAAAGGLVGVGREWSRRLVRSVEPDGRIPGVLLDAWAVALSGGGSWSGAGDVVHQAAGSRPVDADAQDRLAETLSLARRAGVPAAALLRSAAEDLRDDVAAASLAAAERLGVRLVVPLGVCVLPAFVLVGVVPVVVALLSSTVAGLG
ncbi:type II secretion system F family protein [Microbacterium sp. M1A1_1b]